MRTASRQAVHGQAEHGNAAAPADNITRKPKEATPAMTDTRKRVARVKLSLTKRTVEALRPADRPWTAWDDKLNGFVMYDFTPLI